MDGWVDAVMSLVVGYKPDFIAHAPRVYVSNIMVSKNVLFIQNRQSWVIHGNRRP